MYAESLTHQVPRVVIVTLDVILLFFDKHISKQVVIKQMKTTMVFFSRQSNLLKYLIRFKCTSYMDTLKMILPF